MKNMQVGYLKTHFSDVIEEVIKGEKVTINYGRKKEKVAVIVPYSDYAGTKKRTLGVKEKSASYRIKDNFKISDEDMLNS
ncbi:MAG TPA: type II toxin-antitoxin system prevent-host-death family antitoxin [Lentisphaeria bacterium]|nr:MAG: hypothetical protein A2X48_23115 [Lentisphaerae bacterium GWF2_49_21]HBC89408.1 type II toxin-antitoxin system prevent-host-death family antitoxin [Lentisphaeria bacterium]